MPWSPDDAPSKTKRANTPAKKRQFAAVANKVLAESGDDGKALRIAKAAVRDHPSRKRT
jgi:uncharacterized protein YdaT